MTEKYNRERKEDQPVVDFGQSLPHESEVYFTAGQIEEAQTDEATDDQPTPVPSQIHPSVILTLLPVLLHRAYGMTGLTGLIAGFDVKIDLHAFRKKAPNVALDVFCDRVSLRNRQ